MALVIACRCGKQLNVPDTMRGKQVGCPACGTQLRIPAAGAAAKTSTSAPASGNKLRVQCAACGGSFVAKPKLAGKRVACPACRQPISVPAVAAPQPKPPVQDDLWSDLDSAAAMESSATSVNRPSSAAAPPRTVTPDSRPPSTRQESPRPIPTKKKPSKQPSVNGSAIGGGIVVLMIVLSIAGRGVRIWNRHRDRDNQQQAGQVEFFGGQAFANANYPFDPEGKFPVASVPIPNNLPDPRPIRVLGSSGVQLSFVDFSGSGNGQAGSNMTMRVYTPPGAHARASLPCVLVAPAGTPLFYGLELDADDYHDETLPYAEAGMVVVFYSLDGPVSENASDLEVARGYKQFLQAQAGLVNARNALEYAIAKLPVVDPNRIYCAGHSSAATLSLLFAMHDSRVRACVAYAPATDLETRMEEVFTTPGVDEVLPGLRQFLHQSSPLTHADSLRCPTFLFHARDDSNVPYSSAADFDRLLKSHGTPVNFVTANRGDHYQSMIDQGIPQAIQWLKQLN